jgi:hypothetical protein
MRIVTVLVLTLYGVQPQHSSAQPPLSEPGAKAINLSLQLPPMKAESHLPETVKAVCELIAALAWPAVVTGLLISSRKSFPKLVGALTDLVERSDHVKILELIDFETRRVGHKAQQTTEISPDIPIEDRDIAGRVGGFLSEVRLSDIQKRMSEFAREYDETRANMQPGQNRTRAMNAIVARMHVMAILAQPLLSGFAESDQPGKRLAAISILELRPSLDYVSWLVERMSKETPFLLFHASLALRETVRKYKEFAGPGLRAAISRSLEVLDRFERESGKTADGNTKMVLQSTLSELGEAVSS